MSASSQGGVAGGTLFPKRGVLRTEPYGVSNRGTRPSDVVRVRPGLAADFPKHEGTWERSAETA